MFDELIKEIDKLRFKKSSVVVAISGFAGSGKSTLASKLADNLRVKENQIIRIDNLYMPLPRDDRLFDEYNWRSLTKIINDYKSGNELKFTSLSFEGDEKLINIERPPVLIIEGVKLFREEMMGYYDLSVWIDCPLDFAIDRAKKRDLRQGQDDEYMKRWDAEWVPQSKLYFDQYRPDLLVSFLYYDFS